MERCESCGRAGLISSEIGLCYECLKSAAMERLLAPHRRVRKALGLPPEVPKAGDGLPCSLCSNGCLIPEGGRGYCGLRGNRGGKLEQVMDLGCDEALAHTYYDPIPTNCCAAWFCEPCQRARTASSAYNLAAFYFGCNFDCLFCQNAHHKYLSGGTKIELEEFVSLALRPRVRCICHFGGSPEPQLPFALRASAAALEAARSRGRELRICWEWNGCGHPSLVRRAVELALESGGIIKFDLKAWHERLSLALSGVSNRRAYENFAMIAQEYRPRAKHHLLTATTLLVPGYVDAEEVGRIAEFIAALDRGIPYSLLIFHGDFAMADLEVTPLEQAIRCYNAARAAGLEMVNVGNLHLLGLFRMEQFAALAGGVKGLHSPRAGS
ncbi:MAG: radical SAM protein [Candidatus Acetothermia bacterium]|jgi:pyruvate formate lyase activating enzyme|nr:radical SAM protein [Candidatus Acetothermia bacterium]MDH7505423.1 radical SAM protein [Candidatus Acetothermia bacterium]